MTRVLYHIHADAEIMPANMRNKLVDELGYSIDDFAENLDGSASYAPEQHVTFKTSDRRAFRDNFLASRDLIIAEGGFRGYLEGEFLVHDERLISGRPFDAAVPPPFEVELAPPGYGFRESEIHISIPLAGADPALGAALQRMGLFVATMCKPSGIAQIYTTQGTRTAIGNILGDVIAYLNAAGGFETASVKEEVIQRHWLSHADILLPPQIASIRRPKRIKRHASLALAA